MLVPKTALCGQQHHNDVAPLGASLLLCNVVLTQWGGAPADVVQVLGES